MEIFIKRIFGILFSTRLAVIIILIFAISIAVATFIENDFGTLAAKSVVYDALWFEGLLVLTAISLIGTMAAPTMPGPV